MNRLELLQRVKNELPETSGVYIMKDVNDEVIYVGKAKALKRRVKSYFDDTPKTQKTYALVSKIDHFDYILTNSELDAFSLESNLIKKYQPKYNILLKDDKSFPYLKIDFNERYPRLQIVRRPKNETNVMLFGPYVTGTRIGEVVEMIKSAYPIRWCNKNFDQKAKISKPCLYGEICKCIAPCVKDNGDEEYKLVLDKVIEFLNGKTGNIKKALTAKMNEYASELKFEDALVIRNQLQSLENMDKDLITSLSRESNFDVFGIVEKDDVFAVNVMLMRLGKNMGQMNYPLLEAVGTKSEILMSFISNYYKEKLIPKEIVALDLSEEDKDILMQFILLDYQKTVKVSIPKIGIKKELVENANKNANEFLDHFQARIDRRNQQIQDASEKLKTLFGLKRLYRIEAYDISNISGEFSVASMVVFENGEPARKEYRKFKIKTVSGADDYKSIREVISRRLNNLVECKEGFSKKPDLILIDGGFGQLHEAKKLVDELGLDIKVVSLAEKNEEICTSDLDRPIVLDLRDNALRLLQRVRDEAHRFAITYHRKLRGKSLKSSISEIEGVGEQKANLLLKYFKSVEAISKASKSELMKVEGIGEVLAKIIYDFYHD